ncbi:MAG: hypothetical protein R3A10_15425 [Caldilineaceae bacterium]
MPPLIDSLVRTLQVGSMYALMAIGLTLTFAVLLQLRHAELITIGAYAPMSLFIEQPTDRHGCGVCGPLVAVICRAVYRWAKSATPCTR